MQCFCGMLKCITFVLGLIIQALTTQHIEHSLEFSGLSDTRNSLGINLAITIRNTFICLVKIYSQYIIGEYVC